MSAKLWMMAALLLGTAVQAQQTWTYTDTNANFDGSMTIAAPLAANGTQTVSLTSFDFSNLLLDAPNGFDMQGGQQNAAGGLLQMSFTTVNGNVTAWSASWYFDMEGTNTPTDSWVTLSNTGDSFLRETNGYGCMPPYPGAASPCVPISFTGSGGSWADPAPASAPEIDPAFAAAGLMLLLGGIAVLRGSRRRA